MLNITWAVALIIGVVGVSVFLDVLPVIGFEEGLNRVKYSFVGVLGKFL